MKILLYKLVIKIYEIKRIGLIGTVIIQFQTDYKYFLIKFR